MSKLLISGCLLGKKVRYDGGDCLVNSAKLDELMKQNRVISICPEMAGGLPAPRPPAEIEPGKTALDVLNGTGRILTEEGVDVTAYFLTGAQQTLKLAEQYGVNVAVLKADSPSCGSKQIHDGSFSDILIKGMGSTAFLLAQAGIEVFDESDLDEAIERFLALDA
ncbi:MAG: DUF523 domain-containing protein [Gammaproteobacteria bacterium]|nr:DUF523 domain-containing protein [Gammaproteobacteria bacterium]